MAIPYTSPTITIQATGAQSLVSSQPQRPTILALGTAPQGPDVPMLVDPVNAPSLYGDPASSGSIGYTLPLLLLTMRSQRPPLATRASPQFCVCRVGVTRASVAIPSAGQTAFTLHGVGPYAGTAGNNLALVVTTNVDNSIAALTLYDTAGQAPASSSPVTPGSLWQFLQQLTPDVFDLSSPNAIVTAINSTNPLAQPGALMQATLGTAGVALPAAGVYTLTGGANGKGTPVSDASVAASLAASLAYEVDYIVAGYDANALEPTIMAHLNAALEQNQFRQAVLGPQSGTPYSMLISQAGASSTWYNNFQSARVTLVGHDSVLLPNPVTGFLGQYDGFYLAGAVCGLKATSPTEETCIGFPLAGIAGLPLPSDLTAPLSPTQKDTLAGAGFVVCHVQEGTYCVRDALTSAPFSVNNSINPFSQWNVQTIDDAVSRVLLAAVLPFRGRPMPDLDSANALLQAACATALASLGTTINGVQNITVTTDPVSLVPTVDVVYVTRFPFRNILVRTSYVFV